MTNQRMPELDFEQMPLAETVEMLRGLGEVLVRAVVGMKPPPRLRALLSSNQAALLLAYPGSGRQAQSSLAAHIAWQLIPRRVDAHGSYTATAQVVRLDDVIAGRSVDHWRRRVLRWLDRRLGGISSQWLAHPFWALAGEIAWRDTSFVERMMAESRAQLQRRVLFVVDDVPLPVLAPGTYWTLIALADASYPRFRLRSRRSRRALWQLQATASRQVLQPMWAGFWDQWVICEALRLWPNALDHTNRELRMALLHLPVCQQLGLPVAQEPTSAQSVTILARADWAREWPVWLETLTRWDREQPISTQPVRKRRWQWWRIFRTTKEQAHV